MPQFAGPRASRSDSLLGRCDGRSRRVGTNRRVCPHFAGGACFPCKLFYRRTPYAQPHTARRHLRRRAGAVRPQTLAADHRRHHALLSARGQERRRPAGVSRVGCHGRPSARLPTARARHRRHPRPLRSHEGQRIARIGPYPPRHVGRLRQHLPQPAVHPPLGAG